MTRRANPINYERLSPGMRDKTSRTDQGMPHPRLISNMDCDTNLLKRRRGLRFYCDFGDTKGEVLKMELAEDGYYIYVFSEQGIWGLQPDMSYGSYSDIANFAGSHDRIYTAKYKRIEDETFSDDYGKWESNTSRSFTVTSGYADMTPGEHAGKIARFNLTGSTDYEYFQVSTNTASTIYIDGVFNVTYAANSEVRIYDTEICTIYNEGLSVKSIASGGGVIDHDTTANVIATYSGRVFKYIDGSNKILFSDPGVFNFSNDQYITLAEDAGDVIQMLNYFDSLVVICQRAIYTIRGAFPEEFIPNRRMTEGMEFPSWKGAKEVNGVMYILANKGLYSFNRLETQAAPEARPISYHLDPHRFDKSYVEDAPLAIWGNRVLVSMDNKPDSSGTYILVYDTDLSILFEDAWFAEYDGFRFADIVEKDGSTYIGNSRYMYTFEEDQDEDELLDGIYSSITATFETNAIEYGPRGTEKRWRDFKTYMTEYDNTGSIDLYQKLYAKGRDLDWFSLDEWTRDPAYEDEAYSVGVYSPYLFLKLEMKGHFQLEDMELLLFPTALYGKAGKSR